MERYEYQPICSRPRPSERSLAMVYGEDQRLHSVYEADQAIRNGTLFPDLNKPMYEKSMPIDRGNPSAKQAMDFAAWEIRLYLDTHPDDSRALELYRLYCEKSGYPSYACTFAMTSDDQGSTARGGCAASYETWRWLDDPWPWEQQGCTETGGDCDVCV